GMAAAPRASQANSGVSPAPSRTSAAAPRASSHSIWVGDGKLSPSCSNAPSSLGPSSCASPSMPCSRPSRSASRSNAAGARSGGGPEPPVSS
ncbi:hypothetical protein, partial [Novilysobacter longmucuonensis]|uniref:hypothetical protein n=1 Tax=Novilysobacter longmucuonensis TaxID=3098603 RepID=UPI003F9EC8CA